jgi:hypothetical protein
MALQWVGRLAVGLWPRRPEFAPGSVHVGCVVDNVALWQVSVRFIRFPLSISTHRGSPYSYIIWGMNNRPVGGCSSDTLSHPTDMNDNNINNN